jgi:hypothetical protein
VGRSPADPRRLPGWAAAAAVLIYTAAAPTLFAVAWLVLRYVRQLTDAVERLQRR